MDIPYGMSPILDGQKAAIKTEIIWCNISSVNPEKQTMKVLSSESKEEIEVYINQALSISGAGIRYMPIPGQTKAIVHSKNGINTHLGYFVDNADVITDNSTGDKQSGFLLQRFLNPGEVQFMGMAQNEVYLDSDGSIFIKSGYNQFLKLDDIDALLDGEFGSLKFELDGVRIRSGNIRRPPTPPTGDDSGSEESGDEEETTTATGTNEDEYVVITDPDTNNISYPKEFTVSVGNIINADATDYQSQDKFGVEQFPYVGSLSLSDIVYDNVGKEEKVLDQFLNFLLKFPSGISISVNKEGDLVVLDQTNQNFVRFKPGSTKSDDSGDGTSNTSTGLVHNTELEIQINKSNLLITSTGEFTYTLTNPGTDSSDANKQVAVSFKKDSAIEIKNTNDGSKFNTITMDAAGISVSDYSANSLVTTSTGSVWTDKNGNTVTLSADGTDIKDKTGNEIKMTSDGITAKDINGNEVIMAAAGITLKTGDATPWMPNIVPNCIFSGSPHGGSGAGIVKLTGA